MTPKIKYDNLNKVWSGSTADVHFFVAINDRESWLPCNLSIYWSGLIDFFLQYGFFFSCWLSYIHTSCHFLRARLPAIPFL